MYEVEHELRNMLRTNLNTNNTALSGTTPTNVTITNHGLSTGDSIQNVTRTQNSVITVVDSNNFTTDTIPNQTTGDTIQFLRFKHYYTGKILQIPNINYLPILCIYSTQSDIMNMALQADRYKFQFTIEAYINAMQKAVLTDLPDDEYQAQKQIKNLMEGCDPNTNQVLLTTVLGQLRHNMAYGQTFLYTHKPSIKYNFLKGQPIMKATMTFEAVTSLKTVL